MLGSTKVLLLEDEDMLAMLLSEELEENGCTVTRATDGFDGVEKFNQQHFDAIVTDLYMPNMDGIKFLEAIDVKKQSIPVVVITGSNNQEVRDQLQQLAVTNVFSKPLQPTDLQDLLNLIRP